MNLHENKELFIEAIELAASKYELDPSIIEKDYWVTFALKRLVDVKGVIFKGGTSLFKAYGCINRFSEDIDIIYEDPKSMSRSDIRKVEKKVMGSPFEEDLDYDSKKFSNFRSVGYKYNKLYNAEIDNLKDNIVFESYLWDTSYPTEKKRMQALLTETLPIHLIEMYNLQKFELNVLSISRTFFDKIFAINKFMLDDSDSKMFIRHIYDIVILYKLEEIQELYINESAKSLFEEFLEIEAKNPQTKVDLDFCLKDSKLVKEIEKYENEFTQFQREFVFPVKRIQFSEVVDAINQICGYNY